jgi:uncharacterized membrane protein YtjA (UPF0391 family)
LIRRLRASHAAFEETWSSPRVFLTSQSNLTMARYGILFLVVAIIAAALGFGIAAGIAAMIAKVLFGLFLLLFVLALVMGRRTPR